MTQQTQKDTPILDMFDLKMDRDRKFNSLLSRQALAVMVRVGSYGIGKKVKQKGTVKALVFPVP